MKNEHRLPGYPAAPAPVADVVRQSAAWTAGRRAGGYNGAPVNERF